MIRATDSRVLFATRFIRLFCYGLVAVVLALYLVEIGLGERQVGLLFSMALAGDAGVSLWLTTSADTVGRRIAGACLALGLPAAVYASATWLIAQVAAFSPLLGQLVGIGLAYTTLAGRDLFDHVQAVSRELQQGNLAGAREAVARIVGRDSATLEEPEIVRATVETIAESTADGIIAPLVYLSLGGAPLALAYKAVNTLDSMVGHHDERYEHFGWASARLDDVMNWVPARLTGGFIAHIRCQQSQAPLLFSPNLPGLL